MKDVPPFALGTLAFHETKNEGDSLSFVKKELVWMFDNPLWMIDHPQNKYTKIGTGNLELQRNLAQTSQNRRPKLILCWPCAAIGGTQSTLLTCKYTTQKATSHENRLLGRLSLRENEK